jgi:hypothetical protein
MFGIVRGFVRTGLVGVALIAGGGGYAYYRYVDAQVPRAEPVTRTIGICRTTASLTGGTLPLTFEAFTKARDGHNWLDAGRAGLVSARWEWSHGDRAWVLDRSFEESQAGAVAERKKLAARDFPALIEDLASADPIRREIAQEEIFARTHETKGYRYDAPEPERAAAAAEWKRWWADDANRARYRVQRAADLGEKALETLKRALGGPGEDPPK